MSWAVGTLLAELPPEIPVQTAGSAAEQVLRNRGYTITSRGRTGDGVELIGEGPTIGSLPNVMIRITPSGGGALMAIKVGLIGEETVSRVLLEDVLRVLGR